MSELTPEQEREVARVVDARIQDLRRKPTTGPVNGFVMAGILLAAVAVYLYLSRDELGSTPRSVETPAVGEVVVVPPDTAWASTVVSASGHRGPNQEENYSPRAALGAPDVFPACQENGKTWMLGPDETEPGYIEVEFAPAVEASAVIVLQTYGVGSITRVTVGGVRAPLWEGTEEPGCARAFRYDFDSPQMVETVRVEVDPSRNAPVGIDAIGLVPVPADG